MEPKELPGNISELPDSTTDLAMRMQKLIYPYIDHLDQLKELAYYQEYQEAQDHFKTTVKDMVSKGYSAQQLAELLDFAGVDYPVVYDNLFLYALRNTGQTMSVGLDQPVEVIVE